MKRSIIFGGLFAALTLTTGIAHASLGTGSKQSLLSAAQKTEDFQLARRGRGADDAPGDDRGGRGRGTDDGPNHTMKNNNLFDQMARRGADDPAGDDRGGRGRGKDDGANHA